MTLVRSSRRWSSYGSAAFAASILLALAACGSSSSGTKTASSTGSSRAPASSPATSANGIACNGSGTLTASGSTAQQNAISKWAKDYQAACSGAVINYGGGGSGNGVTDFTSGTDDFAGSDFALTASQKSSADKVCSGGGEAVDLPMAPGGIALAYNVKGVRDLNLSASTLAKIFSGKVTKWNDEAITKDNPSAKLPSTAIQTFHRSDGSGTTYNFTNYLDKVAKGGWSYKFGKNWDAPGGQGAKGSAGVAQGVTSTDGGIGYMEVSFATQGKLGVAKVADAGGKFVELTNDNVTAFLAKAKVVGKGDDLALQFDYTAAGGSAYPVTLVTYEITCTKGGKHAGLVKSFLGYTSKAGQDILPAANYVKLPDTLATKVQAVVDKIS